MLAAAALITSLMCALAGGAFVLAPTSDEIPVGEHGGSLRYESPLTREQAQRVAAYLWTMGPAASESVTRAWLARDGSAIVADPSLALT